MLSPQHTHTTVGDICLRKGRGGSRNQRRARAQTTLPPACTCSLHREILRTPWLDSVPSTLNRVHTCSGRSLRQCSSWQPTPRVKHALPAISQARYSDHPGLSSAAARGLRARDTPFPSHGTLWRSDQPGHVQKRDSTRLSLGPLGRSS